MKRIIAFLLAMLMILSITACEETKRRSNKDDEDDSSYSSDDNQSNDFSLGEGTEDSPYVISNADELFKFVEDYNAYKLPKDIYVKLGADININDISDTYMDLKADSLEGYRMWIPIKYFYGTFDGDGHSISGMVCCLETNEQGTITDPSALVGFLYRGATIKNLTIKESFFSSNTRNYVSAFCGRNSGTIENCQNYAMLVGMSSMGGIASANEGIIKDCKNYADFYNINDNCQKSMGGIAGSHATDTMEDEVIPAQIINCVNYGTLTGCFGSSVGGIAGHSLGFIEGCINKGKILNQGNKSGGIVGESSENGDAYGDIKNCINHADIQSDSYAGGIAGACGGSEMHYGIYDCINYGNVSGDEAGGLFGYIRGMTVERCANMGDVTAFTDDDFHGGVAGGICAWDREESIIKDCFNGGNVTASNEAAGLCETIRGQWYSSYSAGLITSERKSACGIANEIYDGKLNYCYFIGEIQGDDKSNTLIKDMYGDYFCITDTNQFDKDLAFQTSWYSTFDFGNIWTLDPSAEYPYPTLRNMPTDFTEEN